MFIDKSDLNHNFRVFVFCPGNAYIPMCVNLSYLSMLAFFIYIYGFHNFKLTISFYGYL